MKKCKWPTSSAPNAADKRRFFSAHKVSICKRTECRRRLESSFSPARPTRHVRTLSPRTTFSTQVEAFTSAGFLHRKGLQYHWRNRDRKIDGSVSNNNGNSKSNNGADTATATKTTVALGTTTPAVPSETAAQVVTGAREGNNGGNKKYADFDSYLGNFASKRRIKVLRNFPLETFDVFAAAGSLYHPTAESRFVQGCCL